MLVANPVQAFKLVPEGSFIERKLAGKSQSELERIFAGFALNGIHKIGEPVHEEITNRVLGCEGDRDICGAPDYEPKNAYVLAGVRWNDDPPFRFETGNGNFGGCTAGATVRLVTFPRCWANVFKDGEKRAGDGAKFDGKNAPILLRSHFGDLQFLHSMAPAKDIDAASVRASILAWAEFTWRIAMGEFSYTTRAKDVPVDRTKEVFDDKGWSIQDLFALGNPLVRKPENMSELVFGSLLHVVEDSFARGHVDRAMPDGREKCGGTAAEYLMPGRILEFHAYGEQDPTKHGNADTRQAFSAQWSASRPHVIDVGRILYDYFVRRASWTDVKPYIECIFTLSPDVRRSSSGDEYAR